MKLSQNSSVFHHWIMKLSSKGSSPSLSREFSKGIYCALCVCSVSNMPVYNLTNKHPELINKSSGFFQRVLQCVEYRIENILGAHFHSYTVSMQVSNLNSKSLLYQENITPAIVSVGAMPHVHACRALLAILLICTLRTLDIYDKGYNFYLFLLSENLRLGTRHWMQLHQATVWKHSLMLTKTALFPTCQGFVLHCSSS